MNQPIPIGEPTWEPGDVVLDAAGNIRVRSDNPRWPWDAPNEGSTLDVTGRPVIPEGGIADEDARRPLVLLVRSGRAVTTVIAQR